MRSVITVALFLLTFPSAVRADPPVDRPREEIEAGYQRLAAAIESKDTEGVEAVLAESFEYVPAEGRALGGRQWVESWVRNFRDVEAYTAASYQVRSVSEVDAGRCRVFAERTVFFRPAGARAESVQVCRTEDEWTRQGAGWLLRSQRELTFPDDGETAEGERAIESARLRRLQDELRSRGAQAVDDFFGELRGHGPLVEIAGSDAGRRVVTFVYRGDPAVREVRMAGGPYREGPKHLTRLDKTDLWYRTENLPSDARFVYFFTVTRPVPKRRADGRSGGEVVVTLPTNDPLNPLQFNGGSVVWPAGGPAFAKAPPAKLRGTLHEHSIKSEALGGEERSFSVYVPETDSAAPPRLLVALDGEDYTSLIPTPAIIDGLIAGGRLPPTVAVFVNHQGSRFRDLRCSPGFATFLADELVPWVRSRYRVTDLPDRTAIAGASLGGLTGAYAGESHPSVFGKVLSQSGAFWYHPEGGQDGWLAARFAAAPRRPVEFWMEVGAFESPAMVSNNRRFRDVLKAKGYALRYREYNGGKTSSPGGIPWRAGWSTCWATRATPSTAESHPPPAPDSSPRLLCR